MLRFLSTLSALCLASSCAFASPPPTAYLLLNHGCLPETQTPTVTATSVSGVSFVTSGGIGRTFSYGCSVLPFTSLMAVNDFLDTNDRDGYTLVHLVGVPETIRQKQITPTYSHHFEKPAAKAACKCDEESK